MFTHTDTHALTQTRHALLPPALHYFLVKAPGRVVLPKAVEGSGAETANSTLNWGRSSAPLLAPESDSRKPAELSAVGHM